MWKFSQMLQEKPLMTTLARLQFMFSAFSGSVRVFRHGKSGRVIALSEGNINYTGEGYRPVEGYARDTRDVWTAKYSESNGKATGHIVHPKGTVLRNPTILDLSEWIRVLQKGDPVLDIHIPEGGGMGIDVCFDSMRRALEFFPKHFPWFDFKSFSCRSWIFNPELADIYTPTCNCVKLQEDSYLYPLESRGKTGLFFVFDREDVDPKSAPRDTSLRRAFIDHLEKGGVFRGGGMFILKEDLDEPGSQKYRKEASIHRHLLDPQWDMKWNVKDPEV